MITKISQLTPQYNTTGGVLGEPDYHLTAGEITTTPPLTAPLSDYPIYTGIDFGKLCLDSQHNPSYQLCIPQGQVYTHKCPTCGYSFTLRNPITQ